MEENRYDFTDIMPTEVLFNICLNMTRIELAKNATLCKKMKQVSSYLLEHKRKIRLVDDMLNVIFVSLPESGKTSLVEALTQQEGYIRPKDKAGWLAKDAARTQCIKLDTMSLRGHNQTISLIDTPNRLNYRTLSWIHASQSDLCVLVLNGMTDNIDAAEQKEIKELITGICHMMSSRDVIVAINIKGDAPTAEKQFRAKQAKIIPILTKVIGPCFDVIPVDAKQGTGVFARSAFPWFKGSALWPMLVENQKHTNYDAESIDRLRQRPFEMQIAFKYKVRGVGTVAAGRVLSGSISSTIEAPKQKARLIPEKEFKSVRCMEMGQHLRLYTAVAGDYVGINLAGSFVTELRKRFGFIWSPYSDPNSDQTQPIDITLAFRTQFVVMNAGLMGLHETYRVHYGSHRVHCVLLWIFPSSLYNTSKDAKQLRKGTAIMVPLERLPIRVYKANEFQKNMHGKVMLTQSNGKIAAIGRIDKVLLTHMDKVPIKCDYKELYETISRESKAFFNSPQEDKLLRAFTEHLQTNSGVQNSIKMFNKRTADKPGYYYKNE